MSDKQPLSDHKVPQTEGKVCWQSPSNIAMIKYWGKRPVQIPINPSLSFVLDKSIVEITMVYTISPGDRFSLTSFTLNGAKNDAFSSRIEKFLGSLFSFFPFLEYARISIDSKSTFPHSAGIASSAAAFSALALCLCDIEAGLEGKEPSGDAFFRKASYIARLGSGSASRSVYNGMVVWGNTPLVADSSDDYAVRLADEQVHPLFSDICDSILIADSRTKKVSSSEGHALMHRHPFKEERIRQVSENMKSILAALKSGDFDHFGEIVENEALTLHGLMMSSRPGYILIHPNTILMLDKIRQFREETGTPAYFTLDAGPNIHLIYPHSFKAKVQDFMDDELARFCENGHRIDDSAGMGPVKMD